MEHEGSGQWLFAKVSCLLSRCWQLYRNKSINLIPPILGPSLHPHIHLNRCGSYHFPKGPGCNKGLSSFFSALKCAQCFADLKRCFAKTMACIIYFCSI